MLSYRSSESPLAAELSHPESASWLQFQGLLKKGSTHTNAECQSVNTALSHLQAIFASIHSTTCFPSRRLGTLASLTDAAGSLDAVRCTVCHSLLLRQAFIDHIASCRAVAAPAGQTLIEKISRALVQVAAHAKAIGQSKAGKKQHSKGSRKPPIGPSRFATEQANHLLPQPAHQAQSSWQWLARPAATQQGGATSNSDAAALASRPHAQVPGDPARQYPASGVSGRRLAWAYVSHISRSNPAKDAVHDPALPPRFPQSVCRKQQRRCR